MRRTASDVNWLSAVAGGTSASPATARRSPDTLQIVAEHVVRDIATQLDTGDVIDAGVLAGVDPAQAASRAVAEKLLNDRCTPGSASDRTEYLRLSVPKTDCKITAASALMVLWAPG